MLRRLGTLLYLLAAALAHEDTFLDKYAFTKVMQHCLGTANYHRQLREVRRAKLTCLGYPQNTFLTTSGHHFYFYSDQRTKRVVTSFHPRDPNKDIYYNSPLTPRLSFPTSDHSTTTSATSLQQPNQVAGGPLWDADTLARAAAHLNAALSNFTCVLVSINAIDEELRVKQDSFVNHYYLTIPNDQLKIDLIQNIYYCYEASEGLPLERDHSPLHARLHRLMFFLKCEKKKRLAACLKHDIRANLDQYNLSGIPGSGFGPDAADEVLALLVGADGIKNLDLYY
ncbi:uncharacterized protein LOC135102114 [Scylla paramamosain]|uniref:uncharacterized protein LOC135102114 n=1 Tax=Scylla paramamosain TaxID=85552 RepID=UPI003083716D